MDFNELLQQFLTDMNRLEKDNAVEQIGLAVTGLCRFLRVERLTGTFFGSMKQEKTGKGEQFTCYDTGAPSEERIHNRIVMDSSTIAHFSIYQRIDTAPWTEEEVSRIHLIQNTLVAYISRLRLEREVEHYNFYDADGYRNLRFFIRELQKNAMAGKLSGRIALNFNLKHFSLVNQQIGRNAGSFVMHNYYDTLNTIMAGRGFAARLGGDNFVILCDHSVLTSVLDYLKSTSVVFDPDTNERVSVQSTAGVFQIPDDFVLRDPGDVLDKILGAGQAARHAGGEEIVFYDKTMEADKEYASQIQRLFPEALKRREFRVFYQPKVDLSGCNLAGAEALCRWFHDGRIIPPMDFIPVLERNTDICKLDFYMLDQVCRDIRRWLDEGRSVVRVSVNLSRKHMLDPDLLEHILETIDRHEVPHKYIEIELTETTTDVEFRDLKRVVSGLQRAGIYTSVDDFGTGFSSLNLIREISWNVLKVDRSFLPLHEDDENSVRAIMFEHVVAMARALGLECIAEGVETPEQVEILRKNHCNLAQGYFYDRPLPVEDFEVRLNRKTYEDPAPENVGFTRDKT